MTGVKAAVRPAGHDEYVMATLLDKYGGPVPRYTSYPTAPHFTEAVDGACYRGWLEEIGGDETISLYCHLPYCDTLCWFCGCHTKITRRYAPVAAYLDALIAEAELVAGALRDQPPVTHLHWGGGSPTLMTAADFQRTMAALRQCFELTADADVAVEIDPRDIERDRIAAYAEAGATRASLGIQDFDLRVQQAINRIQPFEVTAKAVEDLRSAGITRLNFDLMYGLPHQTVAGVEAMVKRAVSLAPDRIALFGYAHVPWMKKHQRLIPEAALPGPAERFAQAAAAGRSLRRAGYVAVGMDHFAQPYDDLAVAARDGRLRRNFQGYTTDGAGALVGLGASAIGALPQGYVQNETDIGRYRRRVQEGELPIARGVLLGADDRRRRTVIERLMCDFEVSLPEDLRTETGPALVPFIADGLVALEGNRLRVLDAGRPFVRAVCALFDAYLNQGAAKHSAAV